MHKCDMHPKSRAKEEKSLPFGGIKLWFVEMGRISKGGIRMESGEGH